MAVGQTLTLDDTMVHEVPRGRGRAAKQTHSVVVSEDVTILDPDTDRFIREQMLLPTLGSARQIVATGEEKDTTTPRLVRAILQDGSKLPDHSRELAKHLFDTQSGSASSGIFLASTAALDGRDVLVLLKAEHQEGVRLRQSGTSGHIAFEVEHISELIVGQNSRVYKIAVLWVEAVGDRVEGLMVDKQNGVSYADYFLHDFLQMSLRHRAEVTTKEFMDGVDSYIKAAPFDAEKKMRYVGALVAVMESPAATIDPQNFLRTFIDQEDRDDFAAALPDHAKAPFTKNTTLVKARIGGMQWKFANNSVQLRATHEAVDSGVVDVLDGKVVVNATPDSVEPSASPR